MKRSELYAKVWAAPVRALAQEVGLSDTRVATICKKHGVPLPARGHWAKVAAGRIVDSTPLPQPEVDYEIKVGSRQPKNRAAPWVVPGVLQRAEPIDSADRDLDAPAAPLTPLEHKIGDAAPATRPPRRDPHCSLTHGELELVHAVAAEYDRTLQVERLLAAAMARALRAPPDDSAAIRLWVERIRAAMVTADPVTLLLERFVVGVARRPPLAG